MTQEQVRAMQQAFVSFKEANDAAQQEIRQFGRESGELKEKVNRLSDALEDLEAKIMRKSNGGFDEGYTSKAAKSEAVKSFGRALRGTASPQELKVLRTGDDTAGGYLAPSEYVEVMLKSQVEFSPVRSIASVRATTRGSIMMPKRTGTAAASWVTETGNRPETTNPSFGLFEVKAHETYALTKVSRQEMEDSVFDLEGFLRAEFAEQFGVAEGAAFIGGSGINQPQGILSNSDVASVNSGHASQITAAGLIDLSYALKDAYQSDAYFCLSRETLREVRKLTDGSGGYLWAPGIARDARPATLLDKPYILSPDMPSIGAGTYPVAYGSFRRGYVIADRIEMDVMADYITSKANGIVEFSARKRVGGAVALPEAIKKLLISA